MKQGTKILARKSLTGKRQWVNAKFVRIANDGDPRPYVVAIGDGIIRAYEIKTR